MKRLYNFGKTAVALTMAFVPAFAETPQGMNRWYEAIRQNDLVAIRALTKTAGADPRDEKGTTPLIYAAAIGSPAAVELLVGAGADVNAQNAFGLSPLMLAVSDSRKVHVLLEHGADVNAKSKVGRTALLLASMTDGASATMRMLIEKGADVSVKDDAMKMTALLGATAANDTQTMEMVLARTGRDAVNGGNIGGITPLMNAAANGNVKIMRELILRGADVNAVSAPQLAPPVKNGPIAIGLVTPLMLAVSTGGTDAARFLLDSGAKPNEKDVRGMTALTFAVASDHADPKCVEALIARGADPSIKDKEGLTAVDWARKFGQPAVLRALSVKEAASATPVSKYPRIVSEYPKMLELAAFARPDVRKVAAESVSLLQKTSQGFLKEGGCVGCHAQELTVTAVRAASEHGVTVDESVRNEHRKAAELQFASGEYMLMQRMDPPAVEILLFALNHLAMENAPASRTTDAVLHNLVAQQRPDGTWHELGFNRAPMADGDFTRTALAIRAIRQFGWKGRGAEFDSRVERATAWLAKAHPVTTEDRVMQLMGLHWAQPGQAARQDRIHDLLALQNRDGGWAQTPTLESDAYATGQVLCALHDLGSDVAGTAYQRGVDFLLRTRQTDGSWHVKSRAPKFQPYFESGFPHGGDQWISSAGTALATAAISYALPDHQPVMAASK